MPLNRPFAVIERVLLKVGVDPSIRLGPFDQDPQYTTCRVEELPKYFALYKRDDTNLDERLVLCCFMLESLNELCSGGSIHPLQHAILRVLTHAGDLHEEELAYWADTSDPDPENWWPLTKHLLHHRGTGGD